MPGRALRATTVVSHSVPLSSEPMANRIGERSPPGRRPRNRLRPRSPCPSRRPAPVPAAKVFQERRSGPAETLACGPVQLTTRRSGDRPPPAARVVHRDDQLLAHGCANREWPLSPRGASHRRRPPASLFVDLLCDPVPRGVPAGAHIGGRIHVSRPARKILPYVLRVRPELVDDNRRVDATPLEPRAMVFDQFDPILNTISTPITM